MPRSKIFFSAILLVMLVGPRTAMAAETKDGQPGAAALADEEAPLCQKKVGVKGRPHRLNTIASLGAVRAWTQKAMKFGEEYSMWHNAKSPGIKCQKLKRSDYYVCFATGKPCRAANDGKTASNKTN